MENEIKRQKIQEEIKNIKEWLQKKEEEAKTSEYEAKHLGPKREIVDITIYRLEFLDRHIPQEEDIDLVYSPRAKYTFVSDDGKIELQFHYTREVNPNLYLLRYNTYDPQVDKDNYKKFKQFESPLNGKLGEAKEFLSKWNWKLKR